jgi:acyl-CoA synthetase (AMP-forming)/AMP-acid ligase II
MTSVVEMASQFVLPAAVATVTGMYLDAKHHLVKDFNQWRTTKEFRRTVVADTAKRMGDYYTVYHALEWHDPSAEGFLFEGWSWSFGEIRREADKLAQWFLDQGIQTRGCFWSFKSDLGFVAVYMTNTAEAYFTAIALSKLGVTNAMVNSALKGCPSNHPF